MKKTNDDYLIEAKKRINKLQTAYLSLQEKFSEHQYQADCALEGYILRMIDIIDMMETMQANFRDNHTGNANTELLIKKVKKRLMGILQDCDVTEIHFENNQIEIGKARVLEKQAAPSPEISSGTILKICRKGYQRQDKVIRPVDVITAK